MGASYVQLECERCTSIEINTLDDNWCCKTLIARNETLIETVPMAGFQPATIR
jgi:hypothetical protein